MTTSERSRPGIAAILFRVLLQVLLGLTLVAAVAWWWSAPGGFPLTHLKFWANRAIPAAIALAAGFALWSLWTDRPRRTSAALLWFALLATAGALMAWVTFPTTFEQLWWLGLLFGVVFALSAVGAGRLPGGKRSAGERKSSFILLGAGSPAAIGCAVLLVLAQRGPPPQTRPRNVPLTQATAGAGLPALSRIPLDDGRITVDAAGSSVDVRAGRLRIECRPLLSFDDYSPDRCWSNLAPASLRTFPLAPLSGVEETDRRITAFFGREAVLDVMADQRVEIAAWRMLPQPVYSHLNTFCELTVTGHRHLFLRFSPCAEAAIEALPADYPVGRPARLAYLTSGGEFRVVEAASGEKGPFRELAAGRIDRGSPLTITLCDGETEVSRLTFDDWTAQAATQLSPTAGWGLPVNAIEFQRAGENRSAPVSIWLSLAATSVGRGWDTVGHSAGVYRNRVVIEQVEDLPSK